MCSYFLDFSKIFDELGGEITCAPRKRLFGRGGQHSDFGCSCVSRRLVWNENASFWFIFVNMSFPMFSCGCQWQGFLNGMSLLGEKQHTRGTDREERCMPTKKMTNLT